MEGALEQIRLGANKQNFCDFTDEFQVYWNRQRDITNIQSLITPTAIPKRVQVYVKDSEYQYVCDKEADVVDYLSGHPIKHLTQHNALFIPLLPGTVLVPPHPEQCWKPDEAIRAIIDNCDIPMKKMITKLCRKLVKREELVICYLPHRNSDGGTFFGLIFKGVSDKHPLTDGPIPGSVHPVKVDRLDRSFIMPRSGGDETLHTKKVAIIGCGSIGGFLALELARSGIGQFCLIDPEILAAENVYRHVLGKKSLRQKKVTAMKEYMEEMVPYLGVEDMCERIEDAVDNGSFKSSQFDIIAVALGSPPLELYLNRLAAETDSSYPAIVFIWVEAYGIGGHIQVSNNDANEEIAQGCLECLYTPLTGDSAELHCRASFAEVGQEFGRNISGCSGLFTPYGSITAVRAATCATEVIINLLKGKELGNPLLSFKGDTEEFERNGFSLTDRYYLPEQKLYQSRYEYVNDECLICKAR